MKLLVPCKQQQSTRRRSPRLQDDNNNTTTAQEEEDWNQTGFDPYKPSTTALLHNRKVTFNQDVQDKGQAAAAAATTVFSTVTPHEQQQRHDEASMALAALCHASDQRVGRMQPLSATHYLEQAVNSTTSSGKSFALQVYAMVNHLHETAPHVLAWTHGGRAFCVYKPKVRRNVCTDSV